uniref:SWIM-type domain-containing protein n=1 Tax=Cannabis sativa TaxID=3483 RepID=A0A803PNR1_CANSA
MEFDPRTKPEEIKFEEGMLFPTNEHLRKALKEYFVTSDREFKHKKLHFHIDEAKGLEKALGTTFEGSEIRFCVRHLYENFKKEFPGLLLKQALWACARSTTSEEFKRKMNDLKEISEPAYNWLMKKAPTEWSKSHFRTSVKCDMLLNNLCESFNSAILDSRDKMIITLLESIRFWLMERMCKQRDSVSKWNFSVGKRIFDIIEKNKKVAQQCICTKSIGGSFQVTYITGQVLSVDLETRTCTCRSFDLTGIPCGHGIACIWFSNLDEYQFVDPCYKKEAFKAIYAKGIAPMPSHDEWENKGKDPPTEKKRKGRPPKKNPDPETVKRNKRRMKQKAREASSSQQLPNAQ